MRAQFVTLMAASAALVLSGCGGSAETDGISSLKEQDPSGHTACVAYMTPPAPEHLAKLEGELDLVLFSGALAHEYAVDSTTDAIAESVNEELTNQGVPSVIAADLVPACESHGFNIESGSAAAVWRDID